MKNVFIIGSKGIPSNYGGFETFVEKLTQFKKAKRIQYHVSCLADNNDVFEHNGARCFNVSVPDIGPAKAVYYDVKSLHLVYKYIKQNNIKNSIVYILACRIGPFISFYKKKFKSLNVPLYVNPDGHEWKRAKWNWLIRRYWKFSEKLMIKNTDLVICDSVAIEKYISDEYSKFKPKTTFIAYGATVNESQGTNNIKNYVEWLKKWNLKEKDYYLIVGRFVAENNYELIIREYIKSKTKRKLVIVTNYENNNYYKQLKKKTYFDNDKRIEFVGTIYNQELLLKVRKGAFAYLHGHEVGGTNPSLLEAMATTPLNLLLDVNFNREVGQTAAMYFTKEYNSLVKVISQAEQLSILEIKEMEEKAQKRISTAYSWDYIINQYEDVFLKN